MSSSRGERPLAEATQYSEVATLPYSMSAHLLSTSLTPTAAESALREDTLSLALERRAKLEERRRTALRRRAKRVGSRFAILLTADVAAFLIARLVLGWLLDRPSDATAGAAAAGSAGPLAQPGQPASLVFWVAIVLALAVTGAYGRDRNLNLLARLGSAALLAGAAVIIPLAALTGLERAVSDTAFIATTVFVVLVIGRWTTEWFMAHLWPHGRGAAPSMLVTFGDQPRTRIEAGMSGGGDYRVARRYVLNSKSLPEAAVLAASIREIINADELEAVVLTETLPDRHLRAMVDEALFSGSIVLCPPRATDVEGLRPRIVWHHEQPMIEYGTPTLQLSALVTKRIMDITGAALLLVLSAPLMALIALGVKLDSRGPVFFAQDRAGVGGRRFSLLKFRTMRVGADAEKVSLAHLNHTGDVRLFKIPSDPRVTRFGKFLRRWSLDELPQFWNVFRGDMSLVGPRPFFQADFVAYDDHHFRRLDTKPGITGLWQIGGRSDVVDFEDVVYLDRQYIEQWSPWLDLRILMRTVPSVIRRTGAY